MRIDDFESRILWRGKVFSGKKADRLLIAYLMFWVVSSFTIGYVIGYFSGLNQ